MATVATIAGTIVATIIASRSIRLSRSIADGEARFPASAVGPRTLSGPSAMGVEPDFEPASLIVAEPAAGYSGPAPLVVDCSVLAAVLFDEPDRDVAAAAMTRCELHAPDLIDHEIISVALKKAHAGDEARATRGLEDFEALRMTRHRISCAAQFETACRFELTAYDAAYLQLALDIGAPLVTFDRKLGKAAIDALGSSL